MLAKNKHNGDERSGAGQVLEGHQPIEETIPPYVELYITSFM
jgi:hypothetical protein